MDAPVIQSFGYGLVISAFAFLLFGGIIFVIAYTLLWLTSLIRK